MHGQQSKESSAPAVVSPPAVEPLTLSGAASPPRSTRGGGGDAGDGAWQTTHTAVEERHEIHYPPVEVRVVKKMPDAVTEKTLDTVHVTEVEVPDYRQEERIVEDIIEVPRHVIEEEIVQREVEELVDVVKTVKVPVIQKRKVPCPVEHIQEEIIIVPKIQHEQDIVERKVVHKAKIPKYVNKVFQQHVVKPVEVHREIEEIIEVPVVEYVEEIVRRHVPMRGGVPAYTDAPHVQSAQTWSQQTQILRAAPQQVQVPQAQSPQMQSPQLQPMWVQPHIVPTPQTVESARAQPQLVTPRQRQGEHVQMQSPHLRQMGQTRQTQESMPRIMNKPHLQERALKTRRLSLTPPVPKISIEPISTESLALPSLEEVPNSEASAVPIQPPPATPSPCSTQASPSLEPPPWVQMSPRAQPSPPTRPSSFVTLPQPEMRPPSSSGDSGFSLFDHAHTEDMPWCGLALPSSRQSPVGVHSTVSPHLGTVLKYARASSADPHRESPRWLSEQESQRPADPTTTSAPASRTWGTYIASFFYDVNGKSVNDQETRKKSELLKPRLREVDIPLKKPDMAQLALTRMDLLPRKPEPSWTQETQLCPPSSQETPKHDERPGTLANTLKQEKRFTLSPTPKEEQRFTLSPTPKEEQRVESPSIPGEDNVLYRRCVGSGGQVYFAQYEPPRSAPAANSALAPQQQEKYKCATNATHMPAADYGDAPQGAEAWKTRCADTPGVAMHAQQQPYPIAERKMMLQARQPQQQQSQQQPKEQRPPQHPRMYTTAREITYMNEQPYPATTNEYTHQQQHKLPRQYIALQDTAYAHQQPYIPTNMAYAQQYQLLKQYVVSPDMTYAQQAPVYFEEHKPTVYAGASQIAYDPASGQWIQMPAGNSFGAPPMISARV